MALDSSGKRISSITPALPWRGPGQFPTGTVDREAAAGLYSGITIPATLKTFVHQRLEVSGIRRSFSASNIRRTFEVR